MGRQTGMHLCVISRYVEQQAHFSSKKIRVQRFQ